MPLEIHERLWQEPGPVQSRPGAPRVLLITPARGMSPYGGRELRYGGRVEPENAAVTLNGRPVRVWPGGVFTGVQRISGPGPARWVFRATANGLSTTVERTIPIARPAPVPQRAPLSFYSVPVSPGGQYWLPPDEKLPVTLYGSPGQRAQARIGEGGEWMEMQPAGEDARRGGVYTIELAPPPLWPNQLAPVYFRIVGPGGESIELAAPLRVGSRPEEHFFVARVTADFGSYLLEPTGWTRWGNQVRDTLAPFFEMRGDRVFVDFDHGQRGWLELSAVQMPDAPRKFLLPDLAGRLDYEADRQTLRLTLPQQKEPLAFVFDQGATNRVRLSLIGASSLILTKTPGNLGPFSIDGWTSGSLGETPAFDFAIDRPLWGFGIENEPDGNATYFVRAAPVLPRATAAKPLAGLRIMLDAGHGGNDSGALSPGGLAESDVNLVEAAWLERYLGDMGAEVLQMRRGDDYVELDRRVAEALDYDPDLFISLHHNSIAESADPTDDRGPIAFYHYEHSRPLADAIETQLVDLLGPGVQHRTQPQNFRVNRNISPCPSVLIETAYLSNPEDELRLRQTEWIRKDAEAIARGVANYVGSIR